MNDVWLEHRPALLDAVLEGLRIDTEGIYIDATFGRGGHTAALLACLGPAGRLLALDRDPAAIHVARERFCQDSRFMIEHACFSTLGAQIEKQGWKGHIAGIVFDLGISSPQIDDPSRGFSFSRLGPLDMRMDPGHGESAATWLANAESDEITGVLREFGEERHAARIAQAIVTARKIEPITTTTTLATLVARANPHWERHKHPATRTFQAIRIFINQELSELAQALPQACEALAPKGRLVVISFHSLEDRIVKRFIRTEAYGQPTPRRLPVQGTHSPRLLTLGKIMPDAAAVAENPRVRSAVLRIAERLEN